MRFFVTVFCQLNSLVLVRRSVLLKTRAKERTGMMECAVDLKILIEFFSKRVKCFFKPLRLSRSSDSIAKHPNFFFFISMKITLFLSCKKKVEVFVNGGEISVRIVKQEDSAGFHQE